MWTIELRRSVRRQMDLMAKHHGFVYYSDYIAVQNKRFEGEVPRSNVAAYLKEKCMKSQKGFTLIELLIVVAIIGIIAAIAIPNLLNAVDNGKQKRTMMDMRSIGTVMESYAVDTGVYPTVISIGVLKTQLGENIPTVDGWGRNFIIESNFSNYTLYSYGKDGSGSNCGAGTTSSFNDEICYGAGQFIRYPAGKQGS
jgi:prepilin-type N-terminal cleavage/methylation domain-containing protein